MKKGLLILIGLAMLGGVALATLQTPATYPAAFWIKGQLSQDGSGNPADITNYKIIFYKNSGDAASAYAYALSVEGGYFKINALEDVRMEQPPFTAGNYFIGVVKKDGYGVDQTVVTLNPEDITNGYKVVPLTLAANQGIPDPTTAIQITSPIGGENWLLATIQNISWEAPASITSFNIDLSVDGGTTYTNIGSVNNAKTYPWYVSPPMSTNCRIRVSNALDPATATVSNLFNIGIPPRRGGPTLEVTALLDGYYDETTQLQRFAVLDIELRAADRTTIVTSEPFYMVYNNNTRAIDGIGENIPEGNYYLVIKHINHLPIISNQMVAFSLTETATIDISNPTNNFEYQPADTSFPAMALRSGVKIMRGGNYRYSDPPNAEVINGDDWQQWYKAFGANRTSANWNEIVDGDGDGNITGTDWQLWYKNFGYSSFVPVP